MFNQYEAHSADISESRIMNSLMSAVNKAAAIEDGPTEISEAALVSMAKLGDSDAFVELSKLHSNGLLRTTYHITRNWHDAEDALQDATLRAFSQRLPGEIQFFHLVNTDRDQLGAHDLT